MNAVLIVVGGGAGGAATVTFLAKYLGDRWLGHVLEKEKAEYQKQLADKNAKENHDERVALILSRAVISRGG